MIEIDGHDFGQIYEALHKAAAVILANTVMGKGVSFMENVAGFHGTAVKSDRIGEALGTWCRERSEAYREKRGQGVVGRLAVRLGLRRS